MGVKLTKNPQEQASTIQRYYQFQSKIYDWTRWSFLFGRNAIIKALPFEHEQPFHLLEVGCGTGINLAKTRQLYPEAKLTGMDVSADMLALAKRRLSGENVVLIEAPYTDTFYSWTGKLDVVLFSYALTMINPQWKELIHQAYKDLRPGGYIAIADFHDSRMPWFKRHMAGHHVRMDGHLLPVLDDNFRTKEVSVNTAYFGVWQYLLYLGKKV